MPEQRIINPYMLDRSKVGTALDHYAMKCGPGATREDFIVRVMAKRETPWLVDQALQRPVGRPVVAEINHNRWIARCDRCQGVEVVDPLEPTFLCFSCMNINDGGCPRPVIFPSQGIMEQIEQALLVRPNVATRNWAPHEPVDWLVAENLEHKLVEV